MANFILNVIPYAGGFKSWHDFITSLFRIRFVWRILYLVLISALLMEVLENLFGLPSAIVMSFFGLNVIEWLSGVGAAMYEGEKFSSRKLGRAFFKTAVYFSIIFALNQYRAFKTDTIGWDVFEWTYWFVFMGLSMVLIRSIFENLHRLEVKEAMVMYKMLNNKYTKILAEIAAPPEKDSEEKEKP